MPQVITSRQNPLIKHLKKLAKDRKYREETGEFLCDGKKLLSEAVSSGAEIVSVLVADSEEVTVPSGVSVFSAPQDVLQSITALSSAQSVLFSCRIKKPEAVSGGKILLLDRLQDTGNVGTVIRTAVAFGFDAIYEDGCADIYNPKTVRAAMGALFKIPVISEDFCELIPRLQESGKKIFSATLSEDAVPIDRCDLKDAAVIIGNEGNGVREEITKLCDGSVIIPISENAESLNAAVAASIFMYKISERQ